MERCQEKICEITKPDVSMFPQPSEEGELLRNRLPATARGYLKHPGLKNGKVLIENL